MIMGKGAEMMIKSLLGAFDVDPEVFKAKAGEIGKIVLELDARLSRIENNQLALMEHFNVGRTDEPVVSGTRPVYDGTGTPRIANR
jgi:hypothetical protein